mmetsp:Transcript_6770/g.18686  ORF Transcript_6770/g.18686 Transcript_6770/m.18686 type:complete len:284 (-) Transcript_6770:327-1178(-)
MRLQACFNLLDCGHYPGGVLLQELHLGSELLRIANCQQAADLHVPHQLRTGPLQHADLLSIRRLDVTQPRELGDHPLGLLEVRDQGHACFVRLWRWPLGIMQSSLVTLQLRPQIRNAPLVGQDLRSGALILVPQAPNQLGECRGLGPVRCEAFLLVDILCQSCLHAINKACDFPPFLNARHGALQKAHVHYVLLLLVPQSRQFDVDFLYLLGHIHHLGQVERHTSGLAEPRRNLLLLGHVLVAHVLQLVCLGDQRVIVHPQPRRLPLQVGVGGRSLVQPFAFD